MGTELSEGTIHKSRHERINAAIGVDTFIEKYNVTHRDVAETL